MFPLINFDDDSLEKIRRSQLILSTTLLLATYYELTINLNWGLFESAADKSTLDPTSILIVALAYLSVRSYFIARWYLPIAGDQAFHESKELLEVAQRLRTLHKIIEKGKADSPEGYELTSNSLNRLTDETDKTISVLAELQELAGLLGQAHIAATKRINDGQNTDMWKDAFLFKDQMDIYKEERILLERKIQDLKGMAKRAKEQMTVFDQRSSKLYDEDLEPAISVMVALNSVKTDLVTAMARRKWDQRFWGQLIPCAVSVFAILFSFVWPHLH